MIARFTLLILRYPFLNFIFSLLILLIIRGIFVHQIYAEEGVLTTITIPLEDGTYGKVTYRKVPLHMIIKNKEDYANYEAKLHPNVQSFEENVLQRVYTMKSQQIPEKLAIEGLLPCFKHPIYSHESYHTYLGSLQKISLISEEHKKVANTLMRQYRDKYLFYNYNYSYESFKDKPEKYLYTINTNPTDVKQRFLSLVVFEYNTSQKLFQDTKLDLTSVVFPFNSFRTIDSLPANYVNSLNKFVRAFIEKHEEKELFTRDYFPDNLNLKDTYKIYEYMSDVSMNIYSPYFSNELIPLLKTVSIKTRDPIMIHFAVCYELKALIYDSKITSKEEYVYFYKQLLTTLIDEVSKAEPLFKPNLTRKYFK